MPFTLISSATAAAKFSVGPVFANRRPSFRWSFESPDGHAVSVYGAVPATPVKLELGIAVNPFDTQPIPLSQEAWTRYLFPGSKSEGITFLKFPGGSVVGWMVG